ncbi:MAG: protein translocase subunit SecD [Anaerolineae bacterium]|nr:protein translocase subunit SecD [Anaerolineae bacterium]
MERRTLIYFVLILLLAAVSTYLVVPSQYPDWVTDAFFWQSERARDLAFRLGLDLQGGLQVLLVSDMPDGQAPDAGELATARSIVERRVNALGLTEPVVQIQGTQRIVVEIPGIDDPAQAVETIRETALLEFVEPPSGYPVEMLMPGQTVVTDYGVADTSTLTTTDVFHTILTGANLNTAFSMQDTNTSLPVVAFKLESEGSTIFADYTAAHIGQALCIVLDKQILSCPTIESAIPGGEGVIQGNFSFDTAQQLALQLQYGALPVPLKIESYKAIGPSLGNISVEKSIRAGVVGLAVVFLFMLIYYRANGLAADLALALYVLLNLLLYKLIPVTLTLPGIAGFLLSAGMAVDANILVFERMKEELRRGRPLDRAAETGFARAWTSVRDSNFATLLTCVILFIFGSAFAASLVKGFAITLALGTVVNVFTAIIVTRTVVRVMIGLFGEGIQRKSWLLGL